MATPKRADGSMSDADKDRFAFVEGEIKTINGALAEQHEAELAEIRSAGAVGDGYQSVGHQGDAARLSPLHGHKH
jgi:hypothetical protein